jgi:NAD(P)-dependent dehydrogenase (short-subunit alcohol dehydrogenase family)
MKIRLDPSTGSSISRREFLAGPASVGASVLALAAVSSQALAQEAETGTSGDLDLEDDSPIAVRKKLGVVIVGGSSGLGAEMARQYARHGAAVVLAARRRDRLAAVAAEVAAAGGSAHVVPTDVRHESECSALIHDAIAWLAGQGRRIDLLVLGAYRAQVSPFSPEMSSAVWRNVIDTSYFGPAFCLREALPHLKENRSAVFYFNSITSSFALPQALGYSSIKHAWRAIMNSVRVENPELTVVSSHFNAVDTEGFDKELTVFANGRRYCPSFFKTYVAPAVEMYPAPLAVAKAIQAIERRRPNVFLSLLNKAAWILGSTHQQLCGFLTMLELVMRHQPVQRLESHFRASLASVTAAEYVTRLLRKLRQSPPRNELITAAARLASFDPSCALFLLALDNAVDEATLAAARQRTQQFFLNAGNGTAAQLMLALSSGALPGGTADDADGFAPLGNCAAVCCSQ